MHIMKFFVKLIWLSINFLNALYAYELPEFLANDVARLLETTMRAEQNFKGEKWLTGKIEKQSQYEGILNLKENLLNTLLNSISSKTLEILNIKEISKLSDIQKEALALFSTQFKGTKIESSEIQSEFLLAACLNVIRKDKNSQEMLDKFIAYIPEDFLEDSDY